MKAMLIRRLGAILLGQIANLLGVVAGHSRIRKDSGARPVVILEPFGMGDIISLEPLARALCKNQVKTTVISKAQWRDLLPPSETLSWLDCELPWTAYTAARKYRLGDYLSRDFLHNFWRLRCACKGAVGIDPRGDIRSVLLLLLAGCDSVLTLNRYLGNGELMPASVARKVEYDDSLRRWELNLLFLAKLNIDLREVNSPPSLVHLTSDSPKRNKSTIGVIPVAPWEGRLWPRNKWRDLTARLRATGYTVIGLCGPNQQEEVTDALGGGVDVRVARTICEWSDVLSGIGMVVSLDSGPMHFSDALGLPTIGLVGPGKLPLWALSGPLSRTIHHQGDDERSFLHQVDRNVKRSRELMDLINVNDVVDAVLSVKNKLQT